jgi:hypothetical protein
MVTVKKEKFIFKLLCNSNDGFSVGMAMIVCGPEA